MADWVHCNSCYIRYKSVIKFNFTSCGHILCEKCVQGMGNSLCAICKAPLECIPISNNLDPHLECYFRPYPAYVEKSKQISNFQYNNMLGLIKHITRKYNYAKTEILRVSKANRDLKKENDTLKLQMSRHSFMSNRSGDSNSRKAPSNFSMNGSDATLIFNKNHRHPNQQTHSLWNEHGEGRKMGMLGVEVASSFESHDVSAVSPSHGSGPSSVHRHRPSFKRVGPSPILPMSRLLLRSGNSEQKKYKR